MKYYLALFLILFGENSFSQSRQMNVAMTELQLRSGDYEASKLKVTGKSANCSRGNRSAISRYCVQIKLLPSNKTLKVYFPNESMMDYGHERLGNQNLRLFYNKRIGGHHSYDSLKQLSVGEARPLFREEWIVSNAINDCVEKVNESRREGIIGNLTEAFSNLTGSTERRCQTHISNVTREFDTQSRIRQRTDSTRRRGATIE